MRTILVVAGDPSGDLHGGRLISALKAQDPAIRVAAVGGLFMRQAADDFIEDLASHGVTGFFEPIAKIGFLLGLARRLKRAMDELRPQALICIDYYGFNRHVLALAKSMGIPAYYYVSPQVWASRPGRLKTLRRLVSKMFVIFPFEEDLYRKAGIPCSFVGHPLVDLLPQPVSKEGLEPPLRVGLLPGSRPSEIKRHLPVFLEAFRHIRRRFPDARASVFAAPGLPDLSYPLAGQADAELVRDTDYRKRGALDIALCSSGTATLENALLGIPMVVVYRMSWPTYAVARTLIRVPYISMANILAGRPLVPEIVQGRAKAENIARAAVELLENPRHYAALRSQLAALRETLGPRNASQRAASGILGELRQRTAAAAP